MTNGRDNTKGQKILKFPMNHAEHGHLEDIEHEAREARGKLFRGEISVENYYQMMHRNRRGPCPNCGQYH